MFLYTTWLMPNSRVPSVKKLRRLVIEFGLTELHTANFGIKRQKNYYILYF